jgi:hypothetical protein
VDIQPPCRSTQAVASSLRSILPLGLRGSGRRAALDAVRHHVGRHVHAALRQQCIGVDRGAAVGRGGDHLDGLAQRRVVDTEGHAFADQLGA